MRPLLIGLSLALVACAPWTRRESPTLGDLGATEDLLAAPAAAPTDVTNLRAARWHLLRALESEAHGQVARAQQDLDHAFRILALLGQAFPNIVLDEAYPIVQ